MGIKAETSLCQAIRSVMLIEHDSSISCFPFSIARDKAVFSMRELTGNIWMASPKTEG